MINLFEKIHKRKRKSNLELQIYSFEFPLVILSNTSIITYCSLVAKLKIDYTPLQMAVLVILSAMMMIIFNVLFYHTNIKLLSNKIIYWQYRTYNQRKNRSSEEYWSFANTESNPSWYSVCFKRAALFLRCILLSTC